MFVFWGFVDVFSCELQLEKNTENIGDGHFDYSMCSGHGDGGFGNLQVYEIAARKPIDSNFSIYMVSMLKYFWDFMPISFTQKF